MARKGNSSDCIEIAWDFDYSDPAEFMADLIEAIRDYQNDYHPDWDDSTLGVLPLDALWELTSGDAYIDDEGLVRDTTTDDILYGPEDDIPEDPDLTGWDY